MGETQHTENNYFNYEKLVDSTPQILWTANAEGKITYFNRFWYQFSGLSENESLEENWKQFVHPKDKHLLEKIWKSGIRKYKPFHLEVRLLDKNNVYRWFLCKAIPFDKSGNGYSWTGTFTDIEEQKKILSLVKNKAEEFEVLANNISHHVWVENRNGDAEYMNKTFYDYTGLSQPDIYTNKRLEIFHPDDFEKLKNHWYHIKELRINFEYEARIRKYDGTYRWFKIRAVPVKDKKGNIIRWIGTNTDIHERKTFEKQKDDFLNIASHELKTPLTTIKGYLQLIQKDLDTIDRAKLRFLLENTGKSVDKLNKLVEDILDINRIETGQIGEIDMETISVTSFLEEIIQNHQLLNSDRTIIFDGSANFTIKGNKHRLEQVFDNLISNASKYSPPHKDISIIIQPDNEKIKISISDHGDGISKENMDKVFERFYRTDDNTLSGLGLGLFIAKEIVKLHHGNIWVESEEGKGSTFHVELPVFTN